MAKTILRVFAVGDEQRELVASMRDQVIEKYDGFILIEGDDKTAKRLGRSHVVEDVSATRTAGGYVRVLPRFKRAQRTSMSNYGLNPSTRRSPSRAKSSFICTTASRTRTRR